MRTCGALGCAGSENDARTAFFRGVGANVARVVPGAAIQFATYEHFLALFKTGWSA